jgi:hypothetical protein
MQPFIFWDGEGINTSAGEHQYALFGASTGERIKYPDLSTVDCLALIMEVGLKYRGINVGFAFGYDVNMMLKDLSIRHLYLLRTKGRCFFEGYVIEHIPRKWLSVMQHGKQVKIFDVFLFFNCKFGAALRKYDIGTPEDLARIDAGKEERPNFTWASIDEIETYWETELKYGASLMEKLRSIIYGAGFKITSWHGPGALASYSLRVNNVNHHMDKDTAAPVLDAARYAMFGGRFQALMAGYYDGPIFERDINSAYAYAFSRLPSLSTGKWVHDPYPNRSDTTTQRMGLYHIRYRAPWTRKPNPLPHRSSTGRVSFPNRVEGWYHAPEAALVRDDPNAEFLEAWLYEDDGTYPFSWIIDAFHERQIMQERGDPCQATVKWMLAALYGQAAQRAGWERKNGPPKWHQLEWAGCVTAECRAMIYSSAVMARSSLVSIDTDGFISLAPVNNLPNGVGAGLGQWKSMEHSGLLYLQNGIYWLRDMDGNWQAPKSRGIPRKKLDFETVYPMMLENKQLELSQHMFIGYGLALRGQMQKWRKWIDVDRSVIFGGNGKAFHAASNCPACRAGKSYGEAMHMLTQVPPHEEMSAQYDLPWLGAEVAIENELKNHAEY